MEFQLGYFKSWKMMLWKCCTQYATRSGKLSSGHRTGKGHFSFQSQRKALPKKCSNYHTIAFFSYAGKVMLKILQARKIEQNVNYELLDVQAGFRKGRSIRDQIVNILWMIKRAREFPEKHLLVLYWLCQRLWLCGWQQKVENSSSDGNTRPPDLPLEKSVHKSGNNS